MKKFLSVIIVIAMVICLGAGLSAFAADAKNVALNDGVSAEVWFDSANGVNPDMGAGFWSVDFLFDGEAPRFNGTGTPPLGWYAAASTADVELFLEITLDKVYEITELKLYPQGFMGGYTFPVAYTVQISEDGTNWTKVGEETDAGGKFLYAGYNTDTVTKTDEWGEDPVFTYACSSQKAKYVQLFVTKVSNPGDGQFYAGLGEFEIFATEVSEAAPAVTEGLRDFDKEKGDALSYDQLLVNGAVIGEGNEDKGENGVPAQKQLVDGSDGSVQKIGMYGWFGNKNSKIASYGYMIDDGAPVYGDFAVEASEDVINAGGESRFLVEVDLTGCTDGKTHKIQVVAKLENGEVVKLNRSEPNKDRDVYVNYKAQLVETPVDDQPSTPASPATGDVSVAIFAVAACALALVVLKKKVF